MASVDNVCCREEIYGKSEPRVRVCREEGRRFDVTVGLRQGFDMSPWLFDLFMDGVITE